MRVYGVCSFLENPYMLNFNKSANYLSDHGSQFDFPEIFVKNLFLKLFQACNNDLEPIRRPAYELGMSLR